MAEKQARLGGQILRWGTHVAAWLPLLWLVLGWQQQALGADPIRSIMLRTGKAALVLLILSLTCTPLYLLFGWKWVYRLRRNLGLYAFMYAALHLGNFVWLDYGLDLPLVWEALFRKRFALVGLASFLILLPMAITSSQRAMSWLGRKRWQQLHRWGYLAAILAVLHYFLLAKQAYTQPIVFAILLTALLGVRLAKWNSL